MNKIRSPEQWKSYFIRKNDWSGDYPEVDLPNWMRV